MIRRILLSCFLSCACGIAMMVVYPGFVLAAAVCCVSCVVLARIFFHKRKCRYRCWIAAAAFFILGMAVGRSAMQPPKLYDENGTVWSLERLDGEWIQGEGLIEQITKDEESVTLLVKKVCFHVPCQGDRKGKLYLETEDSSLNFRPGQWIRFSGIFSEFLEASNPGAFDYRAYCKSLGIVGQVNTAANQLELAGEGSAVRYRLWQLRSQLKQRILELAQPADAGILICLLTGDKSELKEYWKKLYQEGGVIHLLTISGLHISILGMGIFRLLRKIVGSFFVSSLFSAAVTGAFCIMSGSGISAFRATVCFLLFLLAGYWGRTYDLPTAAAVSGLLILLEHPLVLFQSGFLMTFSCVLGIGFLLPMGELIFTKEGKDPKLLVQKRLLQAVLLQLSSLPAVLWFQGEVSLVGVWINLLTVPFMGVILVSGLLAVAFSVLSMPFGIFFLGAAHYILRWYEQVCLFFEQFPYALKVTGRPYGWQIVLWFAILGSLLWIGYDRVLWSHKRLPYFVGLLLLPAAVFMLQRAPSSELTVTFLDVGQGDGIVVELPKRRGIFCIDGGSSSQKKLAEYVYAPYFRFAGIDRVDCWLVTHPDSDHYSGMLQLLEEGFLVDHIYLPVVFKDSELAGKIEKLHPVEYVEAGDCIRAGEMKFEILYPQKTFRYEDENDGSAVVYVAWNHFSALFTGDVSKESEAQVLSALNGRKADLLKVAHHGSKTATSAAFLKCLGTRMAVISSGKNNRYGHPHKEVLDRLKAAGILYENTAWCGCVQIFSDGNQNKISVAKR